ncbi:MAG: hypothetical protein WC539_03640 [Nitrospirota bacterium]
MRRKLHYDFHAPDERYALSKHDIFSYPFKNFGRLDSLSRITVAAVALAFRDAEKPYSPDCKQAIGIVGTSKDGSLVSDREYFKDYMQGGRTLSRANLFIYTLPSSPLGEAAIHFGLRGPLVYATASTDTLPALMTIGADMIDAHQSNMMLVGRAEQDEALYFLLGGNSEQGSFSFLDMQSIVSTMDDIPSILQASSDLQEKKGVA